MKHRFVFSLLLAAGLLLLAAGLIGVLTGPDLMQYAFRPPESRDTTLTRQLEAAREAMGERFPLLTLHGQKSGVTLSAGSASVNDVCLYMTGSRWNEVYPRKLISGRPVSGIDSEQKSKVIVLDRETAFTLFGEADPLGKPVTFGDTKLEVVGVAEHSRSLGETGSQAAWVPLDVFTDCDLLVLSAPGATDASLRTAFQTGAAEVFGAGTLVSMSREKISATIMPRFALLVLALWLLKRWLKILGRFGSNQIRLVREKGKQCYFGRLFPYALGRILPLLLLVALTIGAGFGLALLAVSPIRAFPDWVPESLGDFSAWVSRFWDLVRASAQPVSLQTPEQAAVRFYAVLVRWGLLCTLLGSIRVILGMKKKGETD